MNSTIPGKEEGWVTRGEPIHCQSEFRVKLWGPHTQQCFAQEEQQKQLISSCESKLRLKNACRHKEYLCANSSHMVLRNTVQLLNMFLNLRNMTIVNVNVLAHQTCSSHLHVNNLYPKKLLVEIVGVRHSFPAPIDDLALIHHGETDLPTFSAMGLISLLHMYVLLNRGNSGLTFHIRNVHLNKC